MNDLGSSPGQGGEEEGGGVSYFVLLGVVVLVVSALAYVAFRDERNVQDAPEQRVEGQEWTRSELELIYSLSPPPGLKPSPGNKHADREDVVSLGHKLFFDPRLSSNGEVACSTCHVPGLYFTDGRRFAQGVGVTDRHTPTLIGSQNLPFLFWDGRSDSPWAQALGPLESEVEHNITRVELARVVAAHYQTEYEAMFGPLPDLQDRARFPERARPIPLETHHPLQIAWSNMSQEDQESINRIFSNTGKAIEAYTRKLMANPAPFDHYVAALQRGNADGEGHLSEAARRGLKIFVGEGQCVNCHNGPLLSDEGFHNLGLQPSPGAPAVDQGRSLGARRALDSEFKCGGRFSDTSTCEELRFLDPDFEDFKGAFKTPTLRNIERTAPYMHDGQFASLAEVIAFYKTLPGDAVYGHRELVLSLLEEDISASDLIAFLKALTGPLPEEKWLQNPHAGL